jgi:hypothetical protein
MSQKELTLYSKLSPLRLTRNDLIKLMETMKSYLTKLDKISLTIMDMSFSSNNLEDVKSFLQDVHVPSASSQTTLWIYGKPTIYFSLSNDDAHFQIFDADSFDEIVKVKDAIETFFKKHEAPAYLAHPTIIGMLTFFGGSMGIFIVAEFWATIPYPFLFMFFSLLSFSLSIYVSLSQFTDRPESFSFVYSLVFIDEQKKEKRLAFIVATIVSEVIVSLIVGLILSR